MSGPFLENSADGGGGDLFSGYYPDTIRILSGHYQKEGNRSKQHSGIWYLVSGVRAGSIEYSSFGVVMFNILHSQLSRNNKCSGIWYLVSGVRAGSIEYSSVGGHSPFFRSSFPE